MANAFKKTILIDLDGVLNTYTGKFDPNFIPPIKDGAKEFLENLSKNYEIKLFTTRNKILASKWLIENKIEHFFQDITNTKDVCYLYVDDRCITFDGDYNLLKNKIENFKVWHKS
jgi:hypothetical protein